MRNHIQKGFTLIEILVVVTIIAFITTIIIVSITSAQALARDKRRIADFAAYQAALQEYYAQNKSYPNPIPAGSQTEQQTCESLNCIYDSSANPPTCTCDVRKENNYLQLLKTSGFLSSLPTDPKENTNQLYAYAVNDSGTKYKLGVPLEKDTQAMENDGGDSLILYEVFSTLGSNLAINYSELMRADSIACRVATGTNCNTDELTMLKMKYATTNSHVGSSLSTYTNVLCCSGPADLNSTCAVGLSPLLRLSSNTNAHVADGSLPADANYTDNRRVCLSRSGQGNIECSIKDSCEQDESCVIGVSSNTNAHVEACGQDSDGYKKVCCKVY
jgi:prepilin-type N-terminal cleavage/methylation domain-containing protein